MPLQQTSRSRHADGCSKPDIMGVGRWDGGGWVNIHCRNCLWFWYRIDYKDQITWIDYKEEDGNELDGTMGINPEERG
jgi:hypothetical protein